MLENEQITIYHKANDPIYDSFRQHVKERDEFKHHIQDVEISDRIRIWRSMQAIEEDCKNRLAKQERQKRKKEERKTYYLKCRCCFKKRKNPELVQLDWLRNRNLRIKRQRKNDDNFRFME